MITKVKHFLYKGLRKSEKYTKTDMVYLAQSRFLLYEQIIAIGGSLIVALAFANFVSQETYGFYKYALSAAQIIGAITLTGITTAISVSAAKGFDASLKEGYLARIKYSIFFVLISLSAAAYYFTQDNQLLGITFICIALFDPIIKAQELYLPFLSGKKKFLEISKYNSIRIGGTTVLLCTILYFTESPIMIILTYFLSHTIFTLLLYRKTKKSHVQNEKKDPDLISHSKHLSTAHVLSVVANHIDKVLVFQFIGAAELAIYSFAIFMPEQLKGFIKNIGTLALPKFSSQSMGDIKKTMMQKVIYLMLLITIITIIYIFLVPFIFKFLFPQYESSVFISQIFSISLIFSAILPVTIINAKKAIKENYQLSVISNIIGIIIIVLATATHGLIGLVMAKILQRATTFFISIYLIRKIKI